MPAYADNASEGSRSWLGTNRFRLLLDFQVWHRFTHAKPTYIDLLALREWSSVLEM